MTRPVAECRPRRLAVLTVPPRGAPAETDDLLRGQGTNRNGSSLRPYPPARGCGAPRRRRGVPRSASARPLAPQTLLKIEIGGLSSPSHPQGRRRRGVSHGTSFRRAAPGFCFCACTPRGLCFGQAATATATATRCNTDSGLVSGSYALRFTWLTCRPALQYRRGCDFLKTLRVRGGAPRQGATCQCGRTRREPWRSIDDDSGGLWAPSLGWRSLFPSPSY